MPGAMPPQEKTLSVRPSVRPENLHLPESRKILDELSAISCRVQRQPMVVASSSAIVSRALPILVFCASLSSPSSPSLVVYFFLVFSPRLQLTRDK